MKHGLLPLVVTAAAIVSLPPGATMIKAQRGGGPDAGTPPPRQVPVSTIALAAHADAYLGRTVTLTAAVDRVLSKSIFSIDQRVKGAPAGSPVLVVAAILNNPVELGKYVTVSGELVKFDPEEISRKEKGYQLDLPPDEIEQCRGRPAVLAKVVVNDAMVNLAMRLPPPMSAGEKALDDTMKKVGPTFAGLRGNLDPARAEASARDVALLEQAFAEIEVFWATRNVSDAVKWARDARGQLDAIKKASAGGDWDAAKKSAATLGQACQMCHAAHRERFDDGSFRIKL